MPAQRPVDSLQVIGDRLPIYLKSTVTYNLKPKTSKKGFTLIELMIAIAIIAIIAAVGLTTYSQAQKIARDAKRKQDLRSIAVAIELYYQKYKHYPCTANWLYSYPAPSGANFWITNDIAQSGCGDATHAFNTTSISRLPIDPTNNATMPYAASGLNYSYAYWSANATCNGRTGAGVTYLLVTQLENKSDADRLGAKDQIWCNTGALLYGTGTSTIPSATSFVLVGE